MKNYRNMTLNLVIDKMVIKEKDVIGSFNEFGQKLKKAGAIIYSARMKKVGNESHYCSHFTLTFEKLINYPNRARDIQKILSENLRSISVIEFEK